MANLIAIAFSDIHFYKFNAFNRGNSRLEWSIKAFEEIAGVAREYRVPLLFNGDLFHTPAGVENETMGRVINAYYTSVQSFGTSCYAISGNHDFSQRNGIDHKSPSHLNCFEHFSKFHLLDDMAPVLTNPEIYSNSKRIWVTGIPYMNNESELKKAIKNQRKRVKELEGFKILMLHADCPGAVNDQGMIIPEEKGIPSNLDKFFAPWDLVLMGHIHVPQKLSKKVYMLGSPIAQISSNTEEMGYWKIFSDRPPKFIGLANFPKFIKLAKGEGPKDDINYYIPFEEVGSIEEVEKGDFDLSHSRTKLAKRYLKAKKIKDPKKRAALIKVLNEIE